MTAQEDLSFLLNRGYTKDSAVRFVSDHYSLGKEERYKLKRMVFSQEEIDATKKKRCSIEEIENDRLAVDGYNILITTESVLAGEAFRCFYGVIRDIRGIFGKYRFTERGREALEEILSIFTTYPPKETLFFFDAQISKSGELCAQIRAELERHDLTGDAQTVESVDHTLKKLQMLTATNDSVIIRSLERFVDIPGAVWRKDDSRTG
jgi:hypothetical protein